MGSGAKGKVWTRPKTLVLHWEGVNSLSEKVAGALEPLVNSTNWSRRNPGLTKGSATKSNWWAKALASAVARCVLSESWVGWPDAWPGVGQAISLPMKVRALACLDMGALFCKVIVTTAWQRGVVGGSCVFPPVAASGLFDFSPLLTTFSSFLSSLINQSKQESNSTITLSECLLVWSSSFVLFGIYIDNVQWLVWATKILLLWQFGWRGGEPGIRSVEIFGVKNN